jgi:hypothetical protein
MSQTKAGRLRLALVLAVTPLGRWVAPLHIDCGRNLGKMRLAACPHSGGFSGHSERLFTGRAAQKIANWVALFLRLVGRVDLVVVDELDHGQAPGFSPFTV